MLEDSEHVDRIFRIEEMKGELAELSQGQMVMGAMGEDLPPEIEEQFLESVLAFERAEMVTHRDLLARDGVDLPAPDELTDEELGLKLIELIQALANRRMYLYNTNHLSDRDLYAHLWHESLNEWCPDLPPDSPMNCHMDMIGSGSEEDIQTYLRYYADDADRADWAECDPEVTIPPHEDPSYDRDRHLPAPSPPQNPYDDPEVASAWWAECRAHALERLDLLGLTERHLDEEPEWYAPPLAAIWVVELAVFPEQPDGWIISGDCPTSYLPAEGLETPRAFLAAVCRRWLADAEAMAKGEPPTYLATIPPAKWPDAAARLQRRAEMFLEWTALDEAWEEEGEEAGEE